MRLLLLMDDLRQNAIWAALALLLCIAVILICAPRMANNWKRKAVRALGAVLICACLAILSFFGFFVGADPPRQHFIFMSVDKTKVALLSHSELRDSAATEVTVKGSGCCTRYVTYRYFGDGDDYVGAKSLEWIDDHHLTIRYVRDPSGVQDCHSHVGDVEVLCQLQPEPLPSAKPQGH